MGLDITFKRVRQHRCPDCGKLVFSEDVGGEHSGGRCWYDFLENIGYYTPIDKRSADFDDKWYGQDMILTDEQIMHLMKNFPDCYNMSAIAALVAQAMTHGDSIAVNADW